MRQATLVTSLLLALISLSAIGLAEAAAPPLATQIQELSKQIRKNADAWTPEARLRAGFSIVTLFDRFLTEIVQPSLPGTPEAVAKAFADYVGNVAKDSPLHRQVDDTCMLGYWTARRDLTSAAAHLRQALKALNLPLAPVQDLGANAYKDVSFYVGDLAYPELKHFQEALRELQAGLGALRPRVALAQKALAPADGGSKLPANVPAEGFDALPAR